jgi:hypothetical protein
MRPVIPLALVFLVLAAGPVGAAELVVIEAIGVDLKSGAVVDGAKRLDLPSGARLKLISPSGTVIALKGPYAEAPDPGTPAGPGSAGALARLVARDTRPTDTIGAVRSLPPMEDGNRAPWALPLDFSGTHCLPADAVPVVTRQETAAPLAIEVRLAAEGRRGEMRFAAGSAAARWPEGMPLRDGATYQVGSAAVTLRIVPKGVTGAPRLVWLGENGCQTQAAALIRALP